MDPAQALNEPSGDAGGCPGCGTAWLPGPALGAGWLEGRPARRCPRCSARWAGADPLRDCGRCGCAFVHPAQTLCELCRGGDLERVRPEVDLVRATESEVLHALGNSWRFVRAPRTADYLDRVCRDVATAIEHAPAGARVVLVDEERWRGVGLPSGVVLISRGLLSAVGDEAELAFVIGREIAHIGSGAAGTGLVRSALRALGARGAEAPASPWAAALEEQARFGRGDERELAADRAALAGLLALGYDRRAPRRWIERLAEQAAAGAPAAAELALALPAAPVRLGAIDEQLARWPALTGPERVNRDVFRRAAGHSALTYELRPVSFALADPALAPAASAEPATGRMGMGRLALVAVALTALAVALTAWLL